MKKESEAVIQQEIFMWFNNEYCLKRHEPQLLIHSVPNGIPVQLPEKEMSRALDMMHKTGMINGISDMIIHGVNGRCISVEVKNSVGVQSNAQISIQSRIVILGGIYLLVRSLLDFQLQINNYLPWLLGKE